MTKILDPYEVARKSPLHFWSKADNARYVAYCLWIMKEGEPIDPEPIGGELAQTRTALFEGWLRESSLALELIVKAAFAQGEAGKIDAKPVPSSHNVPQLWKMAGLPNLSKEEDGWLHVAYQVLQWSGRYAAPIKGKDDLCSAVEERRPRENFGSMTALKPMRSRWESFDALYQMACASFLARYDDFQRRSGVPG
ncbi:MULTISPECIES: hypothetical protein [Sphingobium]|uniref:hypothetical protein n=1 Tax=Sphingobium TaxID=165695 RepID=UPI0006746201|nr:hypothetical protein [Sphingobium indicum]